MNKYFLMLVAAGLIAAAPAYYAFQAQAEETEIVAEEDAVEEELVEDTVEEIIIEETVFEEVEEEAAE